MTATLAREDFAPFFAALHSGAVPFQWQERLLDHLITHGRWPELIDAPTGTGKTAAIDVHVFALALTAGAVRLPRRLAMVVPRRSLVDDQLEHAEAVSESLRGAADGILRTVAERLTWLSTTAAAPLTVARLRGGELPSRRWRDDPLAATVLCCTPDMWGSRILMRGYGTSRWMRPVEAALLTHDAAVVVDEAHLARQLVVTARRVAELQQLASLKTGVSALQVVETTATPGDNDCRTRVGVEAPDLAGDEELRRRVQAVKPVCIRVQPIETNQAARRRSALAAWAETAVELRGQYGPTVGCFVNRVDDATALHAELVARKLNVKLICGRLRPHDFAELQKTGLLDGRGDTGVDVIVSTQSMEVGVDVDLSAAVTALAPASSLAQRLGRVNRRGRRDESAIVVIAPGDPDVDAAPYTSGDLEQGLAWATTLARMPGGATPWNVRSDPPPSLTRKRKLYQRLEQADAWLLARTAQSLTAEPDLELWLADELEVDASMGVIVRDGLTGDNAYDETVLGASPPQRHEIVPTTIRVAQEIAARAPDDTWWVHRAGEWEVVTWYGRQVERNDQVPRLRPADVLVMPSDAVAFSAGVLDATGKEKLDDVAEEGPQVLLRLGPGFPVASHLGGRAVAASLDLPTDSDGSPVGDGLAASLDALVDDAKNDAVHARLTNALRLLEGDGKNYTITVAERENDDGELQRTVVLTDTTRVSVDPESRQVFNARHSVLLDQHGAAVAERAARIADELGLSDSLVGHLRSAGLHHDDGKAASRFQTMLGADGGPALAKSGRRSLRAIRRAQAQTGLVRGWRHEQLSAAHVWAQNRGEDQPGRELVTRLVGTSHGRGRAAFDHGVETLASGDVQEFPRDVSSSVRRLFGDGEWEQIVEETDRQWGTWGSAFLEAVLRCADGQISREGS